MGWREACKRQNLVHVLIWHLHCRDVEAAQDRVGAASPSLNTREDVDLLCDHHFHIVLLNVKSH